MVKPCVGDYHLPRRWPKEEWWDDYKIEEIVQSFIGDKRGYYCPRCNTLVVEGTPAWDKILALMAEERQRRRITKVANALARVNW